ncbi:MAG TPA: hypothetical protein VGK64_18670 [Bryobacteraceae bacterium]
MNTGRDLLQIGLRLTPQAARQTILQDNGSDAGGVQPASDVVPFFVNSQMLIAATGGR